MPLIAAFATPTTYLARGT